MTWWRKVLNLPEKNPTGGDELSEALQRKAGRNTPHTPSADAAEGPDKQPLWAEEDESSGALIARRAGLGVVWLVIGLLAFAGLRTIIWPPQQTKTQPPAETSRRAAKDDVPEAAARQVAARFARSYLTWSKDKSKARERELERDLPKGADTKAGWNGDGNQLVAQTIPGEVVQTRAHQARVSVDVRVSTTTGSGRKARTVSSWRSLQVPVAQRNDQVLVTGQPALVGLRKPIEWKAPDARETDTKLTAVTRSAVEDFLKSWTSGTQDQTTAPGAKVTALGGGMKLSSLDTWAVDAGSGAHRTGTATVRWDIAGAELQQTYRITLAQVSASTASRWQVWQVTSQ
ncbi:conjugal transfer protein [Streptomyces qinglanensis]|uniref:conjugal transfer protein n=1 Tax=Streptomyces qinglanensis TaxID=943816 RepID=UPI003D7243F6